MPEEGAERKRRKKEIKALTRRAGALVDQANGEEKGGAARKKLLQRASDLFDQAIAVGPVDGFKFDARLHNNAGVVLVRRENPGDALRHYQRALALYPGYESALGNAAEARAMLHAMHRGEL